MTMTWVLYTNRKQTVTTKTHTLKPCNKQHDLKISRFDVRTLLDIIPTPRKTPTERALARADVQSNRVFNLLQYERYRGVVEALR